MRISDWSSDVCSSDLAPADQLQVGLVDQRGGIQGLPMLAGELAPGHRVQFLVERGEHAIERPAVAIACGIEQGGDVSGVGHGLPLEATIIAREAGRRLRSEEHTSELQSLMRISYAVFCLK